MRRDSVLGTFIVAVVLCVICSVLVSSAAVGLRDVQEAKKQLDRSRNILAAAGLLDGQSQAGKSVPDIYRENVVAVLVDLDTGKPIEAGTVDLATYDPREAARKPGLSEPVAPPNALNGIRSREKYAYVYLIKKGDKLDQIVLPVYGKGLWSTLYGFLALDRDTTTVRGITFYEHAETPGLGGEVENPRWKGLWPGKQVFDDQWNVDIQVIKGTVTEDTPDREHRVDGLSGATITTRGVSSLVQYWLGEQGFGHFLENQRQDDLASSLLGTVSMTP